MPAPRRPPGFGRQGQRQPVPEMVLLLRAVVEPPEPLAPCPQRAVGAWGGLLPVLFVPAGPAWVERWRAPCRTRPTGHRQEEEEEQKEEEGDWESTNISYVKGWLI